MTSDNAVFVPVTILGGLFSIVIFVSGIIYYLVRRQKLKGLLLILIDSCIFYTLLYPTLIMASILASLHDFWILNKLLNNMQEFLSIIPTGLGLYLFGFVQIIAIIILISTQVRSN